jgi:tRNA dimethylallyltransferase
VSKPKVIAVVGQTAAGKTSLAIRIAKHCGGEVISCDSRQVYRGLDIGSGKVTTEEMDGVPHHVLDVADIQDVYTAHDFARDAKAAIADIQSRGRVPVVAGGTFFYLDQLRGLSLPAVPPNPELRAELEKHSTEDLFQQLATNDPNRAQSIDEHNRPRLIRALEICAELGQVPTVTQENSPYKWLVIGINIPQSELDIRIHNRLISRLEAGMIEEVGRLLETIPATRLKELGLEYRYVTEYLEGSCTYDELITTLQAKIRQFSRRQLTWLKRDRAIEWFLPEETQKVYARAEDFLENHS